MRCGLSRPQTFAHVLKFALRTDYKDQYQSLDDLPYFEGTMFTLEPLLFHAASILSIPPQPAISAYCPPAQLNPVEICAVFSPGKL